MKVDENTFVKFENDRKLSPYGRALEIARLILLNYHPDLSSGNNNVLAIMFDMNLLWERFVLTSLINISDKNFGIRYQVKKDFWKTKAKRPTSIIPDIVIQGGKDVNLVLDTKWKNVSNGIPSMEDLRQMFAYMKYFKAKKVALVYPGESSNCQDGHFFKSENSNELGIEKCSIISIGVEKNISIWQRSIAEQILSWSASSEKAK